MFSLVARPSATHPSTAAQNRNKKAEVSGFKKVAAAAAALLVLQGCSTSGFDQHVMPVKGPDSTISKTDYTSALRCVANHAAQQSFPAPRIAVGHISDLTGANDAFNGRRITQGATLMAMTAISDAGMRLVERFDLGVLQVELDYANAGLIRDSEQTLRTVQQGQLQGADLYIVGGITEFNPNIQSGATDFFVGGSSSSSGALAVGQNYQVFDVGIDLRLVDARSSEVLAVRSFKKQLVGYEKEAGVFDFIGSVLIDVGTGRRALEPVQSAVRATIDRAVFEFTAGLYNLPPHQCFSKVERALDHASPKRGTDRFENYHQRAALMNSAAAVEATGAAEQEAVRATLAKNFSVYSAGADRYFAKIGFYETADLAMSVWQSHVRKFPQQLGNAEFEVIRTPVRDAQKDLYILRIGPLNQNSAYSICSLVEGNCSSIGANTSTLTQPYQRQPGGSLALRRSALTR